MQRKRNFFAAPVYDDEEKTTSAYLMNFITIAYFLISSLAIIAAFFVSTDIQQTVNEALIRTLPLLIVLVITQILMRTGRVQAAGLFLGILLWLTTTLNMFITGGASSPALYVYIVAAMVFGLLSGRVYAIISAITSFAMAIVAFILENQGLLPASISEQTAITAVFTYFVVVFLTTSLLSLYRIRLDESVENLRDANLALEKAGAQLEQQVKDRTRALQTSTEVSRRLSTILDQQQLVREVVEQLQSSFGYYHAHIYLYDAARQNLEMAGGTGEAGRTMLARGHKIEEGRGLVGRAAETNEIIFIPDVSKAVGWLSNPLLPDTKAEIAVPIAVGSEVLGVLDVQHDIVGGLSEQDADLIQAIANQVGIAIQNAQAYERAQRQAVRESQIAAINQRIQAATTIDDVLKIAISELGGALGAQRSDIEISVSAPAEDGRGLRSDQ
jgi:putative methionine-R-sulfoxide reductase with GAF domain